MANRPFLRNFELMVLLAVIRLDDAAYGVTISRTLSAGTGREIAIGSVSAVLERLRSWLEHHTATADGLPLVAQPGRGFGLTLVLTAPPALHVSSG